MPYKTTKIDVSSNLTVAEIVRRHQPKWVAAYGMVAQAATSATQPWEPPSLNEPPVMGADADTYRLELMRYTEKEKKLETVSKMKGELSALFTENFSRRFELVHPCRYGSDVSLRTFMTRISEGSKNPTATDAQRKRQFERELMNVKQHTYETNEKYFMRTNSMRETAAHYGLLQTDEAMENFVHDILMGLSDTAGNKEFKCIYERRFKDSLSMAAPPPNASEYVKTNFNIMYGRFKTIVDAQTYREKFVPTRADDESKHTVAAVSHKDATGGGRGTKAGRGGKAGRGEKSGRGSGKSEKKCYLCSGDHLASECDHLEMFQEFMKAKKQAKEKADKKNKRDNLIQALRLLQDVDEGFPDDDDLALPGQERQSSEHDAPSLLGVFMYMGAAAAVQSEGIFDSGASVSVTTNTFGLPIVDLPTIEVQSFDGVSTLRKGVIHPTWGPMYFDAGRGMNILSVHQIWQNPGRYKVWTFSDGTSEIIARREDGSYETFRTFWKHNVLMIEWALNGDAASLDK